MRASDAREGRGGRGGFGSHFRGCLPFAFVIFSSAVADGRHLDGVRACQASYLLGWNWRWCVKWSLAAISTG
jgi:hypothetical protein